MKKKKFVFFWEIEAGIEKVYCLEYGIDLLCKYGPGVEIRVLVSSLGLGLGEWCIFAERLRVERKIN